METARESGKTRELLAGAQHIQKNVIDNMRHFLQVTLCLRRPPL